MFKFVEQSFFTLWCECMLEQPDEKVLWIVVSLRARFLALM